MNADTDVSLVLDAINQVKSDLFRSTVKFKDLLRAPAALGVHCHQDSGLLGLQKQFQVALQGVQTYAPAFPHFSLTYSHQVEESIGFLESEGLLRVIDNTHLEIGGYDSFRIGAIYAAYCGDLHPEKWRIFLKVREGGEEWLDQSVSTGLVPPEKLDSLSSSQKAGGDIPNIAQSSDVKADPAEESGSSGKKPSVFTKIKSAFSKGGKEKESSVK
jgi:hypothetical protein